MISVNAVVKRGSFRLHAQFKSPERVLGVFGPSGAGKSTLAHLIAGLVRPTAGSVQLDGDTLDNAERGLHVPAHRRRIGIVFQEHRLLPHKSVRANLEYGWKLLPPAARRFTTDHIVDLLEIGRLLDRHVHQISGGEQQRVALGRALLSSPRLLVMDEPLAALDRRLKQQIMPFFERVRDTVGIPMIYISHHLEELLRLTDRVLLLENGSVVGIGPLNDLVQDAASLNVLHDRGLTNVLTATVARISPNDGIMDVRLHAAAESPANAAPLITMPHAPSAEGAHVAIGIRPVDIALAVQRIEGISIQNQLPGRVLRIRRRETAAIVELDVGVRLIAEVSLRTAESMHLASGAQVVALIKSHAVQFHGESAAPRAPSHSVHSNS